MVYTLLCSAPRLQHSRWQYDGRCRVPSASTGACVLVSIGRCGGYAPTGATIRDTLGQVRLFLRAYGRLRTGVHRTCRRVRAYGRRRARRSHLGGTLFRFPHGLLRLRHRHVYGRWLLRRASTDASPTGLHVLGGFASFRTGYGTGLYCASRLRRLRAYGPGGCRAYGTSASTDARWLATVAGTVPSHASGAVLFHLAVGSGLLVFAGRAQLHSVMVCTCQQFSLAVCSWASHWYAQLGQHLGTVHCRHGHAGDPPLGFHLLSLRTGACIWLSRVCRPRSRVVGVVILSRGSRAGLAVTYFAGQRSLGFGWRLYLGVKGLPSPLAGCRCCPSHPGEQSQPRSMLNFPLASLRPRTASQLRAHLCSSGLL